jgi:hypothetical protein
MIEWNRSRNRSRGRSTVPDVLRKIKLCGISLINFIGTEAFESGFPSNTS